MLRVVIHRPDVATPFGPRLDLSLGADQARLASVPETPGVPKAEDMIKLLVEGQEAVVRTARSIVPLADKVGDEPTLDLLTQRMQVHEKTAWMLRSLLEK